ncbi:AAA family ATPase [Sandaracinobacteroides hominis]|uniref:AAA family ATPase n=1 Tax=Sandaracinobacteroides hominis TaxID=2780086 RepID=UPI0018F59909|nr:AAA family ATPase [Sandaracinobacteroides hominis]
MLSDHIGQGQGDGPETGAMNTSNPKRREPARPAEGLQRVVFVPKTLGRAPEAGQLADAGIALHEQLAQISTLADNAALLDEADALVVELNPAVPSEMEAFDRLVHQAPDCPVVAAVEGLTLAHARTLLKTGALDAIPLPFSTEDLKQAIEPARRPARPASRSAPAARRHGKVIAVVGAMGGVGTTSIATQMGILWAEDARVALFDLDVQFGSAALFLDVRPGMNMANLLEDAERLDAELMQSMAAKHSSGLDVIASPTDLTPIDSISIDSIDQIFRVAVQAYDVLIVDLPTVWTEWTVRVLQRADAICLVTNMSVPGIYHARRQIELVDANGMLPKLRVIANRAPAKLFGKVDTRETETVLGRKIDYLISNDYPTVSSANDEGRPLKSIRGNAKVVKDLRSLRDGLGTMLAAEGAIA